jgi:hypothetical protein
MIMNKKQIYFKNSSFFALLFVFAWVSLILACSSNTETVNTSKQTPITNLQLNTNSQPEIGNIESPVNVTATPAQAPDGKISKQEMGAEYPFTVDKGILGCEGKRGVGLVTFTANGKTYAVNKVDTGPKKYPLKDAIWADDPSNPGSKIVITPVIQRGMQLCK